MEKIRNKGKFLMLREEIFINAELKRSDIIIYLALIKFMNNETKECYPSIKTIIKFSRMSKSAIHVSLSKLEKNKIIFIERKTGKVNHYIILEPSSPRKKILTQNGIENMNRVVQNEGVVQPLDIPVQNKDTNYTKDNYTKNNKTNIYISPKINENKATQEDIDLAILLESKIRERMPNIQDPNISHWSEDIRKMRTIDKRNSNEILGAILFSQQDDFWQSVILSAAKVRKHFDKLLAQYQRTSKSKRDIQKTVDSILKKN